METISLEYIVRSEIASFVLKIFSKFTGAKIKRGYVLTEDEQEAINRALNSETHTDISELKNLLKSLK